MTKKDYIVEVRRRYSQKLRYCVQAHNLAEAELLDYQLHGKLVSEEPLLEGEDEVVEVVEAQGR